MNRQGGGGRRRSLARGLLCCLRGETGPGGTSRRWRAGFGSACRGLVSLRTTRSLRDNDNQLVLQLLLRRRRRRNGERHTKEPIQGGVRTFYIAVPERRMTRRRLKTKSGNAGMVREQVRAYKEYQTATVFLFWICVFSGLLVKFFHVLFLPLLGVFSFRGFFSWSWALEQGWKAGRVLSGRAREATKVGSGRRVRVTRPMRCVRRAHDAERQRTRCVGAAEILQ